MLHRLSLLFFFFFNDTATTEIYTLSLHDALPIWPWYSYIIVSVQNGAPQEMTSWRLNDDRQEFSPEGIEIRHRSEEHTSELQSPCNLVCRLLLEKKKTSIWMNE